MVSQWNLTMSVLLKEQFKIYANMKTVVQTLKNDESWEKEAH